MSKKSRSVCEQVILKRAPSVSHVKSKPWSQMWHYQVPSRYESNRLSIGFCSSQTRAVLAGTIDRTRFSLLHLLTSSPLRSRGGEEGGALGSRPTSCVTCCCEQAPAGAYIAVGCQIWLLLPGSPFPHFFFPSRSRDDRLADLAREEGEEKRWNRVGVAWRNFNLYEFLVHPR